LTQRYNPALEALYATCPAFPVSPTTSVLAEDGGGVVRVGFCGMSAREKMEDDPRVFYRVRDLQPAELMSPKRSRRITLEPRMVPLPSKAKLCGRPVTGPRS